MLAGDWRDSAAPFRAIPRHSDRGLNYDQLTACLGGACLGGACFDVDLNDVAYWRCVPARVWKCAKAATR